MCGAQPTAVPIHSNLAPANMSYIKSFRHPKTTVQTAVRTQYQQLSLFGANCLRTSITLILAPSRPFACRDTSLPAYLPSRRLYSGSRCSCVTAKSCIAPGFPGVTTRRRRVRFRHPPPGARPGQIPVLLQRAPSVDGKRSPIKMFAVASLAGDRHQANGGSHLNSTSTTLRELHASQYGWRP